MKVNVKDFTARFCGSGEYRHGIYVPEDTRLLLMRCELSGDEFCEVSDSTLDVIEEAKRKDELRTLQYNNISELRLAGMKAESDDDIDSAIELYAEAIEMGEASDFDLLHAYRHAYDRIIILLSRTRAYAREASYIESLLKHQLQTADRERLVSRLQKTMTKIKK